MEKNYFVTSDKFVIADNLTRIEAIKKAKKSDGFVGIGRYKIIKGEKMYNHLPACFYF